MLDKQDKKIEWFEKARLGIFIHWGLYSATEGYYNGEETCGIVEWIQSREKIPNREYERFAEKLSADCFDTDAIADLVKYAGAKYMVFTAKHHEGFAMFDSGFDDYNINKKCGVQEDIVKKLTDSMRSRGIVPCLYYSQGVDFHEENAMGNTWDFERPETERAFESYFNGKCKYQLRELLTKYGDIGVIWFDVPWGITARRAKELRKYVQAFQPKCLINGRLGGDTSDSDFLCMGDNEAPYGRVSVCAETAATTNDSWGYKRGDKNFKTPKMIIELLCAVASKGANLLLNIGPKPNGEIPCEAVDILKSLGNWMQINSDAIYATEASPFISDFSFGWVTQKDKNLFLFLKDPVRKITIYGLENEVLSADSMAGDKVETNAACGELSLSLSNVRFADDVTVIKLVLDGKPNVKNILFQQEQNYIMLPCCACQIKKNSGKEVEAPLFESAMDRVLGEYWGNLNREMKVNINGSVEWWKSEKDSVFWEFETREPGEYEVILYTATNKYQPWVGGHRVRVLCGNNEIAATLSADILPRGVNREYFSETGSILGRVRIAQKGKCSIELRADAINLNDPAGLYVTQMVLRRA